jgi:predicted  nucleic acid-binding Zn-ribbon protein
MPTVPETLKALYALQVIDSQLHKAKRAQAALDNGTAATAAAEAAHAQEQQRRNAHQKIAGDLKDSELKSAAVETKRKNYQQKLYQGTVTNPKELANIEKEIEALGRQQSDLDGRILELMDQAEQAQAALTVAEEQARQADGRRAEALSSFRSRHEALDLELAAFARQRREAEAAVEDKAALKRYEGIRAKPGGIGIARIEGSACGGCHMTLSSTSIKAVKEGAQVQTCENCGRLLLP